MNSTLGGMSVCGTASTYVEIFHVNARKQYKKIALINNVDPFCDIRLKTLGEPLDVVPAVDA